MKILFAERLKELMKEENLNQTELASRIGLKQNTVSTWLSNKKEPCISSVWILADHFGVSVDYLIGRKDY